MDNSFMWLVISELVIIVLIILIKLIFNHIENKKIKSVISFIDKKAKENNYSTDKFKECLEIIEQSKNLGVR